MDHLCDVIIHERPAIVGFQEIRYDESLGGAGDHAQMGHLAARLPMCVGVALMRGCGCCMNVWAWHECMGLIF